MLHGAKFTRLVLITAVLVVNAFVIGLLTYMLTEAKHQQEREVRTAIENLALLLDHNVTESVSKIDLTLLDLTDHLENELRLHGRLSDSETNALLADRREWLAKLADLRVTDASGMVKYGPGVAQGGGASYADREFFMTHRGRGDSRLIVTNLILGRVSKIWVISFTRRYNYPDGRFAGVISAAVPASYFAQLLSGLDLGPHGIALLRDADTALIARHPAVANPDQRIGTKTFSKELAAIIASGVAGSTYHTENAGDGTERTNTYRRLSAVPFHLIAGMGAEDYLADWRGDIRKAVAIATIFLVVTSMFAWLQWRSYMRIEQASRRSRLLLQHASDGIHILDSEGNVIEASDSFCRMLGYARAEVIGMNVSQFDAKFPVDVLTRDVANAAAHREIVTIETRHRCKDGNILDVEIASYPLELDGRSVLYASSRDIIARKQAEATIHQLNAELEERVAQRTAQLDAANRELEEFSYSMSHDMRTPLRALSGFSKILLEDHGARLDDEGRRLLEALCDNAQRMGRLIDDILRFLGLARRSVKYSAADVATLASEIFTELQAAEPARRLRFEMGTLPPSWGDSDMLRQAIRELLSNAIKFSSADDEALIEIGGATGEHEDSYYVRDHGVGFDIRYADKLFKVFERVHPTGQYEGTGIGLAIVKRIVECHGGRVRAEGRVGEGATFYFTLPHRT